MTARGVFNIVIDDLIDQSLTEKALAQAMHQEGKMGEASRHQFRIEAIEAAIWKAKFRRDELEKLGEL